MMCVTPNESKSILLTWLRVFELSGSMIAPVLLGASALSACASSGAEAPRAVRSDGASKSPMSAASRPQGATVPESSEAAPVRFEDGLTWEATLQAALTRHPELKAAQAELDALSSDIETAGLRPNPSINLQVEDAGASGGGYTGPNGGQTTLMVTHTLERGGKRTARQEYSQAQRSAAQAALIVRSQAVISEARGRFLAALSSQEQLQVQRDLLAQLETFYQAVTSRVEAGKASGVDQQQLALLTTHARLEVQAAEAHARTARLQLAQLWDGRVEFDRVEGDWPAAAAPPALEQLLNRWTDSPGRARIESELAISSAAVQSAESSTRQDWDLFAGFRRREQTNDWTATFGFDIPIPVFNGGLSALEAARARRRQSIHQSEATLREAHRELNRIHGALSNSFATLDALEGGALDGAKWLYQSVREGYAQGRFELLQVIEAQKSYFELIARHRQAQIDHHSAWAELEGLLGEAFSGPEQ
ncbi:Cobalt-zinc-cadmium resistance protein CzcC precursor [Planctomycetes bacterium Poly30]|uniref:Cobalt-zinc-cadmium resistance protein CzcC n=1 Tax=Saltatorellus ferox TaxID=2528018 RepID=A0A518EMA1_9BACT|nr:Cobalt-zinc-cadmium resistance protein CzcC precursor [Planctomycetes bacterium Poly30]